MCRTCKTAIVWPAAQHAIDEFRAAGFVARRRLPTPPPGPRPRYRTARRPRTVRLRTRLPPRHTPRAARRLSTGRGSLPQPCRRRITRPNAKQSARRVAQLAPQAAWCELTHTASNLVKLSRPDAATRLTWQTNASPRSAPSATRPASDTHLPQPAAMVATCREFPDHYTYTPADLTARNGRTAIASNAEMILCTQKDLVKVRQAQARPTCRSGPSPSRCNSSPAKKSLEHKLSNACKKVESRAKSQESRARFHSGPRLSTLGP